MCGRMKAQIAIIEVVITLVALFIAFNILFPGFRYKSGWKDALMLLKGRDMLTMLDRTNKLYETSFDSQVLQQLTAELFPYTGIITWSTTENAIKDKIFVACNCTNRQIDFLNQITQDLKVNNRSIDITFCPTNLENINPCSSELVYPDVLIVWGYKNLDSRYLRIFQDFLRDGNGIVEIADLQSGQVDEIQQKIFGLKWFGGGWGSVNEDSFIKPKSALELKYQPYKYFYHIPFRLKGASTNSLPVEGIPSPTCSLMSKGNFTFRNTRYTFWVCNVDSVYWDTNNNGLADMVVVRGRDFQIATYNFTLSYIDSNTEIRVTFKPEFKFLDFLKAGGSKLYPLDDDVNKILLSKGNWNNAPEKPIPVVILNGTETGRTVWVADFSRGGLNAVGDDQKNLLISLLLSMSNKETKAVKPVKTGYVNSYVNVENKDMFEVYRFNLGLGFPF